MANGSTARKSGVFAEKHIRRFYLRIANEQRRAEAEKALRGL